MGKSFYRLACNVMRPIYSLFLPVKVEGLENIPAEGGCIVCANHISARDPFYLAVRVRNRMLHFMAKAELFKWKPLAAFMRGLEAFPVDRGHSDLNAVRTALKLLADGHVLGVFPQGTRSRDNARTPMLSGISLIALRSASRSFPCTSAAPTASSGARPCASGNPWTCQASAARWTARRSTPPRGASRRPYGP